MKFKVGFGYDVHQLVDNHPFWLGGIQLEYNKGAYGHSDADVLIHAICDAFLGAAGLGDIGKHFPDTSSEFAGIDSKILLERVFLLLSQNKYKIGNIDATICLEKPKVGPYIPEMQSVLATILNMDIQDVSIKATTSEKMGFIGREQGVTAYAVTLIYKD